MHPVTAHGFNLGLAGQETLSSQILQARRLGRDIGAADVLRAYEAIHRRETRPYYLATNALVDLYSRTSIPGRLLRRAVLGAAKRLPLMPAMIASAIAS
jgi:2-polyprenyl-6-methoxyphenol hydroxylase-like FAD-dependent oxidoreductase